MNRIFRVGAEDEGIPPCMDRLIEVGEGEDEAFPRLRGLHGVCTGPILVFKRDTYIALEKADAGQHATQGQEAAREQEQMVQKKQREAEDEQEKHREAEDEQEKLKSHGRGKDGVHMEGSEANVLLTDGQLHVMADLDTQHPAPRPLKVHGDLTAEWDPIQVRCTRCDPHPTLSACLQSPSSPNIKPEITQKLPHKQAQGSLTGSAMPFSPSAARASNSDNDLQLLEFPWG